MKTTIVERGRGGPAWRGVGLAVATGLALAATGAGAQSTGKGDAAVRSTLDGVFSAAQAARGEAAFQERCTACHAPGYFTASAFRRSWSGRAVYYLFNTIRTTMPEDSPGSLRPREVADLLAYILRLNTYPE
ncbi:MAG TPA: cytochrome c, partial [Longimicrobiales bacterium]|nr:cytochrome c [Longimicrobiales bacterium]